MSPHHRPLSRPISKEEETATTTTTMTTTFRRQQRQRHHVRHRLRRRKRRSHRQHGSCPGLLALSRTHVNRGSHACTPTAATHTSTRHCATPRRRPHPQASTQDPAISIRPQAKSAPVTATPAIPVRPLARRRLQARRSMVTYRLLLGTLGPRQRLSRYPRQSCSHHRRQLRRMH